MRPRRLIARTSFEALGPSRARRRVAAGITAPWREEGTWLVETEIRGLGLGRDRAAGHDSMQALTLGLYSLVARLEAARRRARLRFVWTGTNEPFEARALLRSPDP